MGNFTFLPSFLHSFIPSILTTTSIFSFILIQFTHSLQMEGAQRTTSSLVDREERAVTALLTRFKTLITLAAEPVEDGATKEMAAADGSRGLRFGSGHRRLAPAVPRAERTLAIWSLA